MGVGVERSHGQSDAEGADVERSAPLTVILESVVRIWFEVVGHVYVFLEIFDAVYYRDMAMNFYGG